MSEGPRDVRRGGPGTPRRHRGRRRWGVVAGLLLAGTVALPGQGGIASDDATVPEVEEDWSIVSADGSRRTVEDWSLSISGDHVEGLANSATTGPSDAGSGPPRRLSVAPGDAPDETVRAISRIGRAVRPSGPHLVLQGGERRPGRPDLVDGEMVWRHGWLGDLAIDLDWLRSLVLVDTSPPPSSDADVVTLANGDRLEGFVVELAGDVVVESIEDGSSRRVPFERVARVDLVEDPRPAGPIRLWTRDGTIVDLEDLRGTRGDEEDGEARLLAFERRGGEGRGRGEGVVFAREVTAVAWRPDGIEPLGRFEFTVAPHPEAMDRPWLPSPRVLDDEAPFGAVSLEFVGPARFEATVPENSILSTEIELPPLMRRFGDLELRLLDGDREVLRREFSAISPEAAIAVPIESGRLVIELGPGLRGPVQDRLRFTLPMLLREPASSE